MEKQKKKQKGITLIALVISIIVMLILAGVSLNMTIGENGIITKAREAKLVQELAQTKEDLEYMFYDYNVDNKDMTISEFLNAKVSSGEIEDFKVYPIDGNLQMIIKKNGNYFYVKEDGGYYSAIQMDKTLDDIQSGFTVVTEEEFKNLEDGSMKFNLEGDTSATLIFYDEIDDSFNFEILGGNVTIYVTQDMTLTNRGLSRSAMDIAPGATLNLYIYEGKTLTVDSGLATAGSTGVMGTFTTSKGGDGAYAGIHVPEGATLNLYGDGTIYAYGGRASNGGSGVSNLTGQGVSGNGGGGRRRGWSWNRRKWWKWW